MHKPAACLCRYDEYRGLVTDDQEGNRLAAALGTKSVLLHNNHGVMVCRETVWQAWDDLYYLEGCILGLCTYWSTNDRTCSA